MKISFYKKTKLDLIVTDISYVFFYPILDSKTIVYTDYNSDDNNDILLKQFYLYIKSLYDGNITQFEIILIYSSCSISKYINLIKISENNPDSQDSQDKAFFCYKSLDEKSEDDACKDNIITDPTNIKVLSDIPSGNERFIEPGVFSNNPTIRRPAYENTETQTLPLEMEKLSKNIFLCKKIFFDFDLPKLETIDDNFLDHYSNLCQLIFVNPDSLFPNFTTIKSKFLMGCKKLESIEIPNSVEVIHNSFCSSCLSLKKVSLSASLTFIGDNFLRDCILLEQIPLPESLTIIGTDFLDGCKKLQKLNLPKSLTTIGNRFLVSCSSLENINISTCKTIEVISDDFCKWCYNLKTLDLSNFSSLKKIGNNFLESCRKLESLILPYSIIEIGDDFCSDCKTLKNLNIPLNISKIGKNFMGMCLNLESVNFYCSFDASKYDQQKIKGWFYGCPNLTAIHILHDTPEDIKKIFQDEMNIINYIRRNHGNLMYLIPDLKI